ncbi:hypothetical protein ACWDO7_15490, partial [Streptomyces sp. NPDC003656]
MPYPGRAARRQPPWPPKALAPAGHRVTSAEPLEAYPCRGMSAEPLEAYPCRGMSAEPLEAYPCRGMSAEPL